MKKPKTDLEHMTECIMIDTIGLRVENVNGLKLPRKFAPISDDPDVVHESWAKGNLRSESGKHMPLRVRSQKSGSRLLVEGSNSMQYVGHNIVSSNDAVMTAFSMLDAVHRQYPLAFDFPRRPMLFRQGDSIEVTRIDTPALLQLPTGLTPGALVNALAYAGLRAGLATSVYPGETVYFDQHSQLAAMKAYIKALGMKRKKREDWLPTTPNTPALIELAENYVRFEAVYRLKHLRRVFGDKPVAPYMLSPKTLASMFLELLEKYDLQGSMRRNLSADELWSIRMPYRSTVSHWQHGIDLHRLFKGDDKMLKSHRRVLNREYSIDIFLPPPGAIEVPVELGEIIRIQHFAPVPSDIRSDPALFYQRDMHAEWNARTRDVEQRGISSAYVDPYHYDSDDAGEGEEVTEIE